MKFLASLRTHLGYHREAYFVAPLALVALYLGIRFVGTLTGRDVTEDIGSLVATLVGLARVALISVFVGAIQKHFVGYRSERPEASFRDDVFDLLAFAFIAGGLVWIVFCK